MTGTMAAYLLWPLLLTIIVEEMVGKFICSERRFFMTILLMNVLTNPLMNLLRVIIYGWTGANYSVLVLLEGAVWIYEAEFIKVRHGWSGKRARRVSLLLNASSFFAGYLLK